MTFLEKIEPHLITDDSLVQETILHALHDYPLIPEDWIITLLEEAFAKPEKLTDILIYLQNHPIHEGALFVIFKNIKHVKKENLHLVTRLLENIEPYLALEYKNELSPYINDETWQLYNIIENGEEDDIIRKYEDILDDLHTAEYFNADLFWAAKKLTKCLVDNGWYSEEEIAETFREEMNFDEFTYFGILNVYMAGLLKLEKFIPALASMLRRDEDILLEEVATALISFQTDEVVKVVAPYLKEEESLIFATSIIENIKSELAVQSLMEAYNELTDDADQDLMIEALCHQFSKTALPVIEKHMEKEYHTTMVEVEKVVYSYYTIVGEKHRELNDWKEFALQLDRDFENRTPMFSQEPVRNEVKIGRNDPCPCGSGKKFKKCCG